MDGSIGSPTMILWMIGVCAMFMTGIVFMRPLKFLIKVALQGAVGLVAVYVVNFIAAPMGLAIGLNFFNAAFIGLLGIPGFVTLYVSQYFL